MPKMSKAQKARQNNLQKARDSHKATVEEVPDEGDIVQQTLDNEYATLHSNHFNEPFYPESDPPNDDNWDLDLGNELPDIDCNNISDGPQEPDQDEEIVVAPEITEETALDEFSQFLFSAQAAAQKAEKAQQAQNKRHRHYTGNTLRTKCHHRKLGKDLAQKQFYSVHDFMVKKKAAKLQNTDASSSAGVSAAQSSAGGSTAQSPAASVFNSSESSSEDEVGPSAPEETISEDEPGPSAPLQTIEIPDCIDASFLHMRKG
ncbi:hypothetical protein K438DRAFT_2016496 [Mycena galopus ATCC 62051]|nr:hypothetical protein K438DRAFT_2016496 [Mycena galopus ATCC 62051]